MKQGPLMDRLIKKKEWPILWHSSNWLLHIFKLLQKTTRRRFIIDWSIYFTFGTNNIALLCEQSSKGVGLYGGKKFPWHPPVLWQEGVEPMTFGSYWATLPIELYSIYALLGCISFNLLYCTLITRTFKKLLENAPSCTL